MFSSYRIEPKINITFFLLLFEYCRVCDLPCRAVIGVKIHHTKTHDKNDQTTQHSQDFMGRLTDRVVRVHKEQQTGRPTVFCEGETLDNVFKFPCLGGIFDADGLQEYDINVRVDKTMTRCGKLGQGHMFDSPDIGP